MVYVSSTKKVGDDMSISFNKALGIHPQALEMRGKRMELLASNIANADTPGYKARDLEFANVLKSASEKIKPVSLFVTHESHIKLGNDLTDGTVLYRIPHQAALDGNTVESQVEQVKYAENALQYQISMQFVGGSIQGLLTAIRGE